LIRFGTAPLIVYSNAPDEIARPMQKRTAPGTLWDFKERKRGKKQTNLNRSPPVVAMTVAQQPGSKSARTRPAQTRVAKYQGKSDSILGPPLLDAIVSSSSRQPIDEDDIF
jgi:hypothetical protein